MTYFTLDLKTERSLSLLNSCMHKELYYHRIFLRPRRDIALPRVPDPKVDYGPLMIFVQEAIDFSLARRYGRVEWPVPFDIVQLRIAYADKIYFNSMIGRAICHLCAISEALHYAREGGFNASIWLHQKPSTAMEYAAKFLEIIRLRTRPVNISIIYMLIFASYLVFQATTCDRSDLVDAACRSTVYIFYQSFPYEWIYWNTRLWSLTYNALHNDLHGAWQPGRFEDNLA